MVKLPEPGLLSVTESHEFVEAVADDLIDGRQFYSDPDIDQIVDEDGGRPSGVESDADIDRIADEVEAFHDRLRFYTDDDIDRIVEKAGGLPSGRIALPNRRVPSGGERKPRWVNRRRGLSHRLQKAAYWFLFGAAQRNATGSPAMTDSEAAEAFASIEKAARRLLAALRASQDGDISRMPPQLKFGLRARALSSSQPPAAALRERVLGVADIRRWAEVESKWNESLVSAVSEEKRKIGMPVTGRPENMALSSLIGELGGIWSDVFGREPATTVSGPFERFVAECLEPLNIESFDLSYQVRKVFGGKK